MQEYNIYSHKKHIHFLRAFDQTLFLIYPGIFRLIKKLLLDLLCHLHVMVMSSIHVLLYIKIVYVLPQGANFPLHAVGYVLNASVMVSLWYIQFVNIFYEGYFSGSINYTLIKQIMIFLSVFCFVYKMIGI